MIHLGFQLADKPHTLKWYIHQNDTSFEGKWKVLTLKWYKLKSCFGKTYMKRAEIHHDIITRYRQLRKHNSNASDFPWYDTKGDSNRTARTPYHGHAIEKMKKHQAHNSEGHITYYRTPIASEKTICQAWHQQQAEQRMHLRGVETSFIMVKVHMRIQGLCLTH